MNTRIRAALLAIIMLTAACNSAETASDDAGATSPTSSPKLDASKLEGSFDVGDHKLHMRCTGSGSPTVDYLHGYIFKPVGGGGSNSGEFPALLDDDNRVRVYDRANVGMGGSDSGPLTGRSSIEDLHALLRSAKVEGPTCSSGASFRLSKSREKRSGCKGPPSGAVKTSRDPAIRDS